MNHIAYKLAQAQIQILPKNTSPKDYSLTTLMEIMGKVIGIMLIFAGVVAVIFIIIGGIKYAFSYGNPQAMESGKSTLLWAILGLVIVLCSYAIAVFVWKKLTGMPAFDPF